MAGWLACCPSAAAAGADAAAEALYGPCNHILHAKLQQKHMELQTLSVQFSSVQFSIHHKTAYETAQTMPIFAGCPAGLLLLLLVLMLLLKPYVALVAIYCPKTQAKKHKITNPVSSIQLSSIQCSPQDIL